MLRFGLAVVALALMALGGFVLAALVALSVMPASLVHSGVMILTLVFLIAPTSRKWPVLLSAAAAAAVLPAFALGWQLLQPSSAAVAQVSRHGEWVEINQPSFGEVLTVSGVTCLVLFSAYSGAFFLWKQIVFEKLRK